MKRFKYSLPIAVFCLLLPFAVIVQSATNSAASLNTIYLELLGNSYLYSVNYERILATTPKMSYSARIGISYFNVLPGNLGEDTGLKYRFFPLTFNVIRHFDKNNLEVGLGIANEFTNIEVTKFAYRFIPTIHTGYRRYMRGNLDFRAGINLSRADLNPDNSYEIFPWPYLSIGKRF